MKRLLGVLGLVVLFASTTASAQERADDGAKEEEPSRSWYGYQTLATDGIALTMGGLGLQAALAEGLNDNKATSHATSRLLLVGGGLTYLFAAPTVHALHGHWGKAGGSFALRGAPVALGATLAAGGDGMAGLGAGVIVVGMLAAMVIDSAVIANESTPPPPKVSVAPTFDPKNRAPGVAFAATF